MPLRQASETHSDLAVHKVEIQNKSYRMSDVINTHIIVYVHLVRG